MRGKLWESTQKALLHYITLHYITLHYITLHYITLHYITYITLHYITLQYITLHYITLHYITLHYITLHYITLHYITLHYITLHYITLHYITLHYRHCKSHLHLKWPVVHQQLHVIRNTLCGVFAAGWITRVQVGAVYPGCYHEDKLIIIWTPAYLETASTILNAAI